MRLRFRSLGSGSRGNATLVQSATTLLLIDCGFGASELARRCHMAGIEPDRIDALLLTHEHGDHNRGAAAVARKWKVPIWSSHGTALASKLHDSPCWQGFSCHAEPFVVGDIRVRPFTVPHDAREPSQFRFESADRSLGILTDCGSVTPHMKKTLDGVDALLLECNHDREMLAGGAYPASLKRRVGGSYGHLNNEQSAALLGEIDHGRLRHVAVAHISEQNNRPELARAALQAAVPDIDARLEVLAQDQVSPWMAL